VLSEYADFVEADRSGMKFGFKTNKSAGVRVTRAVHQLISEGNSARDSADWPEAVDAYRRALASAPYLDHIRIQLGHALKQSGRLDEADLAYADAAHCLPGEIEPIRCRAYLAKDTGQLSEAVGYFAEALDTAHRNEAADEINRMIEPAIPFSASELLAMLREVNVTTSQMSASTPAIPEAVAIQHSSSPSQGFDRPLVFDITDLVAHFQHQRLPNGIERVQMEVLRAALQAHGGDRVGICCFVNGREQWVGIRASRFLDVARLAASSSDIADADWQTARATLLLDLMIADAFAMPMHAVLINTGTSWRVHDYFRFVRNAKERFGISYIPFVHDLIPIVASAHCVSGITEDFISWLIGAIRHADAFLVNSGATRADLLRVAEQLGHPLSADRIEVVPLDADFRRTIEPLPTSALNAWHLMGVPFALLVSTIESRKNHILAFDAWAELIRLHGPDAIPRLVCVGRDGWLNDHVFARLNADPALRAHVMIIHQLSDAELALFYRACRFTVYPSLYEGWGLPVTESLSYGRIPVVADNSSLPEAGGPFALLFQSGSTTALVKAVEQILFDDCWRTAREQRIAAEYAPRTWVQLEAQIVEAIAGFSIDGAFKLVRPAALPNRYYPMRLQKQRHVWKGLASGEIFRVGDGWLWPETTGCRITPQGGELQMRIADRPAGPLRLWLRLRGLSADDCSIAITINGRAAGDAEVPAGTCRWIMCDLCADDGTDLSILIRGRVTETVSLSIVGTRKSCFAGITVLGFLLDDGKGEEIAALSLNDAVSEELEKLSAYRNEDDLCASAY
jgi:glycosyltransferase involved in cell wall biosynthesis